MDEIRALQKRLADAVAGVSTSRLSERNVVELVEKLKQLGILNDLVFTIDGKEYITKKQISDDLADELLFAGGRLSLQEVTSSGTIGVDYLHIEQAALDLVKNSETGEVALVNGELLTSYYLDTVSEEINELLIEAGQIPLDSLAKRFNLTNEYLRQAIEPRLGAIILGKLDADDTLYTQAFIERLTAQLQGTLTGVTWPTKLATLRNTCRMNQEARFFSTFEELVTAGKLPGSIKGRIDKAIYTPDVFGQAQKAWIDSAYRRDGYLEYNDLDKLQVSSPKSYMRNRFGNSGYALDSMFVASHIVDSVHSSIKEVAHSNSITDVMNMVSFPLTFNDAVLLIEYALELDNDNDNEDEDEHGENVDVGGDEDVDGDGKERGLGGDVLIICDTYVLGSKLLEELKDKCRVWVEEEIKKSVESQKNKDKGKAKVEKEKDKVEQKKPRRRARKGKDKDKERKQNARNNNNNDSDDDDGNGNGNGKSNGEDRKSRRTEPFSELRNRDLAIELICRNIPIWKHELKNEDDDVINALAEILAPYSIELREEIIKTMFVDVGEWVRKRRQFVFDELQRAMLTLHMHSRALQHYEGEGKAALLKHLYKTDVSFVATCLVTVTAFDGGVHDDDLIFIENGHGSEKTEISMSEVTKSRVLKSIPRPQRTPLLEMFKTIGKESVEVDIVNAIQGACDELGMYIPNIDRKREKAFIHQWKVDMKRTIQNEKSAPELLLAVVLKLYSEIHGGQYVLSAAGRSVGSILECIKTASSACENSFMSKLAGFHHLVVRLLSSGSSDSNSDDIMRLKSELDGMMSEIRVIGELTFDELC